MAKEVECDTWEHCEDALLKLIDQYGSSGGGICFRGQGNSTWSLDTTLERHFESKKLVQDYFVLMKRIKSQLEVFTEASWELPERQQVDEILDSRDSFRLESELLRGSSYPYAAYLRQHGFPSPLLDWTRSPYIAAYFAFTKSRPSISWVAIFAFIETPENQKSWRGDKPKIIGLGPEIKTHQRHFKQQSQYTVCVQLNSQFAWEFAPHHLVFDNSPMKQDLLYKYVIPINERRKVLRKLELANLNAYTLFGSEESLLETLAIRQIDLEHEQPSGQ